MKVFSLNHKVDDEYVNKVWNCILQNIRYIKKFNGANYEEAMYMILARAVSNRKEEYADITPYIKKLARTELRQRNHCMAYNPVDEESGEVARPFIKLTETFDALSDEKKDKLKNVFRDMYLLYPDDIIALRDVLLKDGASTNTAKVKPVKLNEQVRDVLWSSIQKVTSASADGGRIAYTAIMEFYDELAKENSKQLALSGNKTMVLGVGDYRCVTRLPNEPTIRITDRSSHFDEEIGIDYTKNIKMTSDVNLDLVSWVPISKSKCDVIKIDINPLVDYLYENIYVRQGVNTPLRRWIGERYVLTTPGGVEHLNIDPELYLDLCKEEFLLNLIQNNVNTIIGFTSDSVYVKPVRKINYDILRCKLFSGKIIDLNVSYFKSK